MARDRWLPWRDENRSAARGYSREREQGNFIDRFFSDWGSDKWDLGSRGWSPSVDIVDRNDEVILRADMPGASEKDIEVSYHDGIVTIRGERHEEHEEEGGDNYYRCERWSGTFSRNLMLPPGIDPDSSTD